MELNSEIVTSAPRHAATVVMLRDGAQGLEVFLVKRHGLSDVLGGAYVFPGGKLDREDAAAAMAALVEGSAAALHGALGEPDLDAATAVSLYVAAAREAFEEAGVLFAQGAGRADAVQAMELSRQGMAFDEVLAHTRLRLEAARLVPWSRWITPVMPSVMRKRFDTRFFLATLPEGQDARHDDREAVESAWLRPRDALEQYHRQEIELAPPQIMSLAHLSRHPTVANALDAARSRLPPVIQPEPFQQDDSVRVLCYPGDERHPVRERALPGPTRLLHRAGRFEPPDGFESLFA